MSYIDVDDPETLIQALTNPIWDGFIVGYEAWGINIIIDNTFRVNDKLLLGLKAFTQPYQGGHINSGILVRLGFQI